jgi:sec-independent protein translocase protein TatA
MGLDNPIHIAFLLILLLLVFGAKRLPEMGKSLGTGMRGFKDSLNGDNHSTPAVQQPTPVAPAVTVAETAAPEDALATTPAVPVAAPVAVPVVVPAPAPVLASVGEPSAPAA